MPKFGLAIGTDRAAAFQAAIQDELIKRGYCPDADPVMSDYITIMIINNKTSAQITAELEDLIGPEFDPSFTDWLFNEAVKGASDSEVLPEPTPSASDAPAASAPLHVSNDSSRRPELPSRPGVFQQAIGQALPSTSSSQKRSASARSPSPNHPNKSRRTDLPTGPRAMLRDGSSNTNNPPGPRSLIDRVGPARGGPNGFPRDDIQARIDNITNTSPDPNMMMGGFPPNGMDMNMAGMANPLMLQEMMMSQMALMAQMVNTMGMNQGQFAGGQGFPMQGVAPGDMGMYQGGMNGFPQQGNQNGGMNGGGRGRGRGGRGGSSRGRGGPSTHGSRPEGTNEISTPATPVPIVAPTPITVDPAPSSAPSAAPPQGRTGFVVPERPLSPTICKFGPKCTNAHCRYSHPSPVATPESGVVLSNDACEMGKDCKDKDCTKAHVSPAVLNPLAVEHSKPAPVAPPPPPHSQPSIPCRFGAACTRPDCAFSHPHRAAPHHKFNPSQFAQQCRFGAGCTRASCSYQHPEGRVLPSTFHRGLAASGPMVNVPTPETGSMGGASHNRSVKFNTSKESVKEKLEKQVKTAEEKKNEAEKALKEVEAAAAKKDGSNSVAITA